ncbi:MAG: iron-containing alcohol dehydrogenase [Pseudomonadota bacterium]
MFHPNMLPGRVICDPTLTVSLPKELTAATGMDALSHNLEAYCSNVFHPMAEGIAVEGIRLINIALQKAVVDGENLLARAQMLAASTMGATAFQKGLGAMHAIAHAVGAMFDAQHGLINAVLMPYVLLYNRSAIDEKLTRLAHSLQFSDPTFDGFLEWVLSMRENIGIPDTLSDIGVSDEHAETLAANAAKDPSGSTNPVPMEMADFQTLIQKAIEGDLTD